MDFLTKLWLTKLNRILNLSLPNIKFQLKCIFNYSPLAMVSDFWNIFIETYAKISETYICFLIKILKYLSRFSEINSWSFFSMIIWFLRNSKEWKRVSLARNHLLNIIFWTLSYSHSVLFVRSILRAHINLSVYRKFNLSLLRFLFCNQRTEPP